MPISPSLSCDWPNIILALDTMPGGSVSLIKPLWNVGRGKDSRGLSQWEQVAVYNLDPSWDSFGFYHVSLCLSLNTLFWMWIEIVPLELKFACIFKITSLEWIITKRITWQIWEFNKMVGYKARKFRRFLNFSALARTS